MHKSLCLALTQPSQGSALLDTYMYEVLHGNGKLTAWKKLVNLTPARTRCFATFARAGGGGVGATPPPGDLPLMVVELREKIQSMRLDEISRLHILFLVLG